MSGVSAPDLRDRRRSGVAACSAEARTLSPVRERVAAGWQLTNRGIAAVLIAGAVLAAAAITVITATAVTVTSDSYHPHGSAIAGR